MGAKQELGGKQGCVTDKGEYFSYKFVIKVPDVSSVDLF